MKIIETILNLIYPNVCGFCGDINNENICTECSKKIEKYKILGIEKSTSKYIEQQCFIYKYEGEIRESILKFKFQEEAYLYKTFVKIILDNLEVCKYIKKFDIIIPVPIHRKRRLERGYNQSELIANEISKQLIINIEKSILIKIRNNPKQSTLKLEERKSNVKNVYEVKQNQKIKDKKILLIDDIFTTGNTVNECAKKLKEAGANKVSVLTIARD